MCGLYWGTARQPGFGWQGTGSGGNDRTIGTQVPEVEDE